MRHLRSCEKRKCIARVLLKIKTSESFVILTFSFKKTTENTTNVTFKLYNFSVIYIHKTKILLIIEKF